MLKDKRILVISPQPWGEIHVSKHYYAIELAKRDNKVVYLNPLKLGKPKFRVEFVATPGPKSLSVAIATLPIPSFLRFKWRSLYDWLIDFFSARLARKMGGFDIVWCFDPNYFHNLRTIAPVAVYHPVDPITEHFQINCGRFSDVIISVSHEIMKAFKKVSVPQFIINHGVSGPFRSLALKNFESIGNYVYEKPARLRFGYVGNLLRKEIDWNLIYTIIQQNQDVEFNFWGPGVLNGSNLAGDNSMATRQKIQKLTDFKNVRLHGIIPSEQLPEAICEMDGFLLIYKYLPGQSDRSNSHKILEFFCTGKTLVSFKVKAYENNRDLLVMPEDDSDEGIPGLFSKVVNEMEYYNDRNHVAKRLSFALDCSYEQNLSRIEGIFMAGGLT